MSVCMYVRTLCIYLRTYVLLSMGISRGKICTYINYVNVGDCNIREYQCMFVTATHYMYHLEFNYGIYVRHK